MYIVLLIGLDLTFLHGNIEIWKNYCMSDILDSWKDLLCILNV